MEEVFVENRVLNIKIIFYVFEIFIVYLYVMYVCWGWWLLINLRFVIKIYVMGWLFDFKGGELMGWVI